MKSSSLTLIVLLTAVAFSRAASEWPQFRGPNGSAIAANDKPGPIEFGLDRNLLWKTALPSGISSPVIWGGRIFLTALDQARQKLETICLERVSGKVVWRRAAPTDQIEEVNAISNPANATPATDGEAVYVYFGSFGLIAYDFQCGARWQKPLPAAVTRFNHGGGSSPVLASGQLMLDLHLGRESHLLAVRCRDGETLWKAPKPLFNDGWSTPVVWREQNGERVGILNAGRFTAHDLKTGQERWWIQRAPNQICATPAVGNGFLYLTGTGVLGERHELIPPPPFDDLVSKYDANKDGRISTDAMPDDLLVAERHASGGAGNMSLRQLPLFQSSDKCKSFDRGEWANETRKFDEFARGDWMKTAALAVRLGGTNEVTDSQVAWTEFKGVPEVPSPLLYRGRLFLIRNGGLFTCRDAATGKTIFEERLMHLCG
jgi:outer membrane protein assembly factor BamB